MADVPKQALRAWVDYLRDLGLHEVYSHPEPRHVVQAGVLAQLRESPAVAPPGGGLRKPEAGSGLQQPAPSRPIQEVPSRTTQSPKSSSALSANRLPSFSQAAESQSAPHAPEAERSYFNTEPEAPLSLPPELAAPMPKPQPLEILFPPLAPVAATDREAALERLRTEIGDCTRCPLAYAGRHSIVFGEGDPNARLMFVGEGPGADEDASGRPFIGKAGQLLNNMITAMGLTRGQVYIANIVKCRPPGNRTPEFVEATTCSQFLLQQIDIVRPEMIVALGSTAASYVLGVRQSLASLRGEWFSSRGAKVAITYHPAFLLRDPRQKAEAWKDLQRVMAELGLTPPSPRKAQ